MTGQHDGARRSTARSGRRSPIRQKETLAGAPATRRGEKGAAGAARARASTSSRRNPRGGKGAILLNAGAVRIFRHNASKYTVSTGATPRSFERSGWCRPTRPRLAASSLRILHLGSLLAATTGRPAAEALATAASLHARTHCNLEVGAADRSIDRSLHPLLKLNERATSDHSVEAGSHEQTQLGCRSRCGGTCQSRARCRWEGSRGDSSPRPTRPGRARMDRSAL